MSELPHAPRKVTLADGTHAEVDHGSVVIAAITSCTNTSNPAVMIAAGLLARKARQRGLGTKPWVKTSLAPGSRVVVDYLERAGLLTDLEALRFYLVGFGCTTCIGNSGPLDPSISQAVHDDDLSVCSVLSGNRNFEGRIHADCKLNYLASPPLVVAFALAGTLDLDITREPLGFGADGKPVYLRELWPTSQEVEEVVSACVRPEMFAKRYAHVFEGDELWQSLKAPSGALYAWDENSTYVKSPPLFGPPFVRRNVEDITGARALLLLGDSVTTDHISPAGSIRADSPAGKYLAEHGVERSQFNSYGSRRGNHEVMMRGTFANVRLRNRLAPGTEGGFTRHLPSGEVMTVFDASRRYASEGVPLVIVAGKEYGAGSSRDWAAKGTLLLGVWAVIAEGFERIHRSNLVGMGVLPLEFRPGESAEKLGLTGEETFDILGLRNDHAVPALVRVRAGEKEFTARVRVDTPAEARFYRVGGILPSMLGTFV